MSEKKPNPLAKQLVLEKYPTASAYGDGHGACIRVRVGDVHALGYSYAPTSEWAWHVAAVNLGLIKS